MTVWLIEPRDPLLFRDGKPFGATPGVTARSLAFPFPSTIAGGARSQAALDADGVFLLNPRHYKGTEHDRIEARLKLLVEQLTIRGPLLAKIPDDGQDMTPEHWLVPAPRDALMLTPEEKELPAGRSVESYGSLRRLVPLPLAEGSYHDLDRSDLLLVGMQQPVPDKPHGQAPHYWTWQAMREWLLLPDDHTPARLIELAAQGHNGPAREQRVHVSMDFRTRAGKAEALFATDGLEFTCNDYSKGGRLASAQSLGLVVLVEDRTEKQEFPLRAGPACLGSERRIVYWHRSTCEEPACPIDLVEQIIAKKACHLLFLTPAHFKNGYLPDWSELVRAQWRLQPEVKAIAIDRPQIVSGWDIVARRPKETRRLAPAGTVLFLSLEGATDDAIRDWIAQVWMQCVSDELQDRCDGYGLAVLGTYSGEAWRKKA